MSVIAGFFIFVAVIAIAATLFGGWVIVLVVRGLFNGMFALFMPGHARSRAQAMTNGAFGEINGIGNSAVRCGNAACMASNPADARFCRRCGRGLPAAARVQVRRAAVW